MSDLDSITKDSSNLPKDANETLSIYSISIDGINLCNLDSTCTASSYLPDWRNFCPIEDAVDNAVSFPGSNSVPTFKKSSTAKSNCPNCI
eukprot:CAMPEP_0119036696 /NCGR_PEP_ID=MMETSP1177-20130426/4597_1 /TAXON_ID=2985 /ORGANISM="Ochromonas sp, Strain CCMP1899" /LENGTH=89 /DNA_ID=CAMNT_0006996949 /DNA_START=1154 /DNA_END=1423 /DNA_ORIENTATION=+